MWATLTPSAANTGPRVGQARPSATPSSGFQWLASSPRKARKRLTMRGSKRRPASARRVAPLSTPWRSRRAGRRTPAPPGGSTRLADPPDSRRRPSVRCRRATPRTGGRPTAPRRRRPGWGPRPAGRATPGRFRGPRGPRQGRQPLPARSRPAARSGGRTRPAASARRGRRGLRRRRTCRRSCDHASRRRAARRRPRPGCRRCRQRRAGTTPPPPTPSPAGPARPPTGRRPGRERVRLPGAPRRHQRAAGSW